MATVTAIDVGSHGTRALTLKDSKHGLAAVAFASVPASQGPSGIAATGIRLKDCVTGLAGKDMTLRYTQVPPSPDWQLANLMELEIQDMAGQSGGQLSADYNLLPIEDEEGGMDTVLLAFARDEALERVSSAIQSAGGSVAGHIPNCIALYNAYLRCGPVEEDSVTCLVNIGHETADIAIVRGVDLLFVRNLNSGGKVFDEAISSAFNVSAQKSEQLKRELLDLDPFSRGQYASGQAEKVTMAAGGAGNMIVSAIQSSIAFCRSQTKQADLQLDRVLLCGGTARTRGIKGMLRESLRTPVDVFDPFENVDLSGLDDESAADLDRSRYEAVVALGLAASKLDDSLYDLEILPEAVKKRRAFFGQTIYNIAAAAIAVVVLVLFLLNESARVEAAESDYDTVRRQRSQVESIDKAAAKQIATNEEMRALAEHLSARAMPLHGALLALREFQSAPPSIWVHEFEVSTKDSKVRVRGETKDVTGGDVGMAYRQFLSEVKARTHDGVPVKLEPRVDGAEFTWEIDYRPPPPPPKKPEEEES